MPTKLADAATTWFTAPSFWRRSSQMHDESGSDWLFLTGHGAVLLSIAGNPTIGIGELARLVGTEERATEKIIADLVAEGYVDRRQEGQSTRYEINRSAHLRHPLFKDVEIGPLIDALQGTRFRRRTA